MSRAGSIRRIDGFFPISISRSRARCTLPSQLFRKRVFDWVSFPYSLRSYELLGAVQLFHRAISSRKSSFCTIRPDRTKTFRTYTSLVTYSWGHNLIMSTPSASSTLTTTSSTLQDHPSLVPAFHLTLQIGPATPIGSLSRGTPLTVVPLVSGTFVSEPGFDVRFDGTLKGQGVDYFHNDPDGGRMRLKTDLVVQ